MQFKERLDVISQLVTSMFERDDETQAETPQDWAQADHHEDRHPIVGDS